VLGPGLGHCVSGRLPPPARVCAGSGIVPAVSVVTDVPRSSAQEVWGLFAAFSDVEACKVEPVTEPRVLVPRPVVPRPSVPRPDAPTPDTASAEFAVAVAEIPELDEEDGELMTPELLAELHGIDVLAVALTAPDNPDVGEFVKRLIPPPWNVGSVAVPGEHGAGLAVPE